MSIIIDISNSNDGVTFETGSDNVSSAAVANEASIRSAADAALSLRINSISASGGGGSVTSTELSAAVAVETSNRQSADNVLSLRITSVAGIGGAGSVTSQELSVAAAALSSRGDSIVNRVSANSADATSVRNRLSGLSSNALLIMSGQFADFPAHSTLAATDRFLAEDDNNGGAKRYVEFSVLKARIVETLSAQVTSADGAASVRIDSLANRVSANSATGGSGSVTSQELSVIAAGLSSRVDVVSTKVEVVSGAVSIVSVAVVNKTISSLVGVSITGAIDQQFLVFNSADGKWHASTIAAGAGSVTSQKMSVAIAVEVSNRQSADNALSVRVDTASNAASIVSVAQAATSAAVTSVNDRVSAHSTTITNNSAQMTSADNAISAAAANAHSLASQAFSVASAVSVAQAATSAAVTSVNNRVSGISTAVTNNSAQMTSADNAISAAAANAHSLASQAFSVASAVSVAQAATSAAVTSVNNRISAISTTVTNNSAQMTSADNAISANLASVATRLDGVSAQMTSADNAISAAAANAHSLASQAFSVASAVSVAQAATSAAVTSVNNRISGVSGNVTSIAGRVDTNSAQMVSADNAISNALSALSAYVNKAIGSEFAGGNISAGSVVVDFANGKAQAFSIQGSVAIAAPSNLSAGANYVLRFQQDGTGNRQPTWNTIFQFPSSVVPTFGGASAVDIVAFYYGGDGVLYGQHNAISVTVGGASVTSAEHASVDARVTSVDSRVTSIASIASAAASAAAAVSAAVTSVNDRISANSANITSTAGRVDGISANVTSIAGRVDTNSAQMVSADNAISNAISVISANYLAGLGTTQMKVVADQQSVSATALTNISGLSISVAANGVYEINARVLHRASTTAGYGFGLSMVAMSAAAGRWIGQLSIGGQTPVSGQLSGIANWAVFNEGASNSVVLSVGTGLSGNQMTEMVGLFQAAGSPGTLQLLTKASAGVHVIQRGSYIRALKIG